MSAVNGAIMPTSGSETTAREYCYQGETHYKRRRREDNRTAAAMFTRALEIDPAYAPAYIGLSDVYRQRAHNLGLDRAWLDAAIQMASAAIALAPQSSGAHRALATACAQKGWLRRGLKAAQQAIQLDPSDAAVAQMVGWLLWFTGRADEAVSWMEQAVALQPADPWMHFYAGNAYLGIADFPQAASRYGQAVALQANLSSGHAGLIFTHLSHGADDLAREQAAIFLASEPDEDRYYVKAADVLHFLGDDEARRLAETAVANSPTSRYRPRGVCATTLLGNILRGNDETSAAEAMLQRSVDADRERMDEGDDGYEVHYDLAAVYAIQGDRDAALTSLEHAINAGWRAYPLARRDPLLANLHGDRGFHQLLTRVETAVAEMRCRVPATDDPTTGDQDSLGRRTA